ncbi:ubinuclein-1 isoform X2 [Dunckerocampus dactyliophorus]|uniref:ubinuclein-1 isoform X2 n=1 Tax=Dunckerocampus dactyliophorus TaxID=161453 RepID=UPI0024059A3E|nr:ubinuclein-1 isoform X2 [Dunckerocampus dactyliophorus]
MVSSLLFPSEMAQPRRVQLTSLTCQVNSAATSTRTTILPPEPAPCVGKKNTGSGPGSGPSAEGDTGSIRLVLTLFEPDDHNFPEFSYSQLLENKKSHSIDEVQPRSIFEEEEQKKDQLADIARKMEEKYAVNKKRDRVQDLIDIGYGYDDEDSFIDNSEAYDEFVPSSITTKFGGFYVNSGVLHFREASDADDEKTPGTSKKRKPREDLSNPKKKSCHKVLEDKNDADAHSSETSEMVAADEMMMLMKKKKKKKGAGTLSVTRMLKKFRREKELERQEMERAHQSTVALPGTPRMPLCPADAGGGGGSGLTDPLLNLIGSTNEHVLLQAASRVDFDIDLDCLLDVGEEISSPQSTTQSLAEALPPPQPKTDDQNKPCSSSNAPPSRKMTQTLPLQYAALPEGLPPLLEDSIKKLMLVAKTSENESKLKFFTPEVNSVLLDIDCQCREHGGQLRSRVYTHLSSFLPCSKETLLKRVKKLKLAENLSNVEDPVQKLKEAIERAMPEQIACFNQEYQEYQQVRTLRTTEEANDIKQGGLRNNVEDKGVKRGGGPKKLFKWNEEIREGLCNVLKGKLDIFKSKSEGSHQLEDYLKTFLDNDIKHLWPKGWMQSRVLISESRKMLGLQPLPPMRRSRSEKKLSVTDVPNTGSLPVKVEPHEVVEASNSSYMTMVDASNASCVKTVADTEVIILDSDSLSPPQTDRRLLNLEPANILTDQTLAYMRPLVPSQELLAAAVAKYKHSLQHWTFSTNNGSPPLPPPPQCSPVNFPEDGLCQVALPQLLQDFMRPTVSTSPEVQMGSDDVIV